MSTFATELAEHTSPEARSRLLDNSLAFARHDRHYVYCRLPDATQRDLVRALADGYGDRSTRTWWRPSVKAGSRARRPRSDAVRGTGSSGMKDRSEALRGAKRPTVWALVPKQTRNPLVKARSPENTKRRLSGAFAVMGAGGFEPPTSRV